LIQPCRTL